MPFTRKKLLFSDILYVSAYVRGSHRESSNVSGLTNSALVYEPKCGGKRGEGCGVSANEYSCTHGAQINFGDLTPYLTYALRPLVEWANNLS
jgi:hypothetical protein